MSLLRACTSSKPQFARVDALSFSHCASRVGEFRGGGARSRSQGGLLAFLLCKLYLNLRMQDLCALCGLSFCVLLLFLPFRVDLRGIVPPTTIATHAHTFFSFSPDSSRT